MFYELSIYNWADFTILIVEDDVSSTFYLKEVLKDTHVNILHAPDGQKAVDICTNTPSISLVLMDIRMPIMNGFDATRAIRLIRPDLPIIAQTANTMLENRVQCKDAGCNDFIGKPIDSEELLEIISGFLK